MHTKMDKTQRSQHNIHTTSTSTKMDELQSNLQHNIQTTSTPTKMDKPQPSLQHDRTHYISLSNHCSAFTMYTQVFLRVQFLALYFSPCILSLCLPLLTHTLSYIIHLLMTYNFRCLLPQIEYLSYFTLCSHV